MPLWTDLSKSLPTPQTSSTSSPLFDRRETIPQTWVMEPQERSRLCLNGHVKESPPTNLNYQKMSGKCIFNILNHWDGIICYHREPTLINIVFVLVEEWGSSICKLKMTLFSQLLITNTKCLLWWLLNSWENYLSVRGICLFLMPSNLTLHRVMFLKCKLDHGNPCLKTSHGTSLHLG